MRIRCLGLLRTVAAHGCLDAFGRRWAWAGGCGFNDLSTPSLHPFSATVQPTYGFAVKVGQPWRSSVASVLGCFKHVLRIFEGDAKISEPFSIEPWGRRRISLQAQPQRALSPFAKPHITCCCCCSWSRCCSSVSTSAQSDSVGGMLEQLLCCSRLILRQQILR